MKQLPKYRHQNMGMLSVVERFCQDCTQWLTIMAFSSLQYSYFID